MTTRSPANTGWLLEPVNSLYRFYTNGYPSGSLLKDESPPTMIAWSPTYTGSILMATRASQCLYGSYPDGYSSGSLLNDGGSPTMIARSYPDSYPSQSTAYTGPTLTATPRGVS